MSMRKWYVTALALLLAAAPPVLADDTPNLGKPIDAATLADLDFTVLPDGDGLPSGSGTALAGRKVYAQYCQACHGENGAGGVNDTLAGGQGTLRSAAPQKTVGSYWPYATTVFDYIRRAMPLPSPGVLTNDEIYAVTAYILYLNDIIPEDAAMTATSLPAVRMPNRDGFIRAWPP